LDIWLIDLCYIYYISSCGGRNSGLDLLWAMSYGLTTVYSMGNFFSSSFGCGALGNSAMDDGIACGFFSLARAYD